jgi:HSP20 family molecular chaperone IbpA
MRAFDFAPLYRSTVGFDRVFSMLDQFAGVEDSVSNYPPYNIERASENAYRISVAVAGFTDADLSVETKENRLTIRGELKRSSWSWFAVTRENGSQIMAAVCGRNRSTNRGGIEQHAGKGPCRGIRRLSRYRS